MYDTLLATLTLPVGLLNRRPRPPGLYKTLTSLSAKKSTAIAQYIRYVILQTLPMEIDLSGVTVSNLIDVEYYNANPTRQMRIFTSFGFSYAYEEFNRKYSRIPFAQDNTLCRKSKDEYRCLFYKKPGCVQHITLVGYLGAVIRYAIVFSGTGIKTTLKLAPELCQKELFGYISANVLEVMQHCLARNTLTLITPIPVDIPQYQTRTFTLNTD